MEMEYSDLPDEVWIMILAHVSLSDRVCSVQFVCRRFSRLCWDYSITKSLNFESESSMKDKECLQTIRKTKSYLTSLSFKNCHWFSGAVYRNIPMLPLLRALDLTGCHLTGIQMHHFLSRCPKLRSLACYFGQDTVAQISEQNEDEIRLNIGRLHITCPAELMIDQFIEEFIMKRLILKSVRSFSLEWRPSAIVRMHTRPATATKCGVVSTETLQMFGLPGTLTLCDGSWKNQCEVLSGYQLHSQLDALHSEPSPVMDLSTLRFLSFAVPKCWIEGWQLCRKSLNLSNVCFPNVECLIVNGALPAGNRQLQNCFVETVRDILQQCQFPKLWCLNVSNSRTSMAEKRDENYGTEHVRSIITNENLRELSLKGLAFSIGTRSFRDLDFPSAIQAISLPLNILSKDVALTRTPANYIECAHGKRKRVSRFKGNAGPNGSTYFQELAWKWPRLRELEVANANVTLESQRIGTMLPGVLLEPIGQLKLLQNLCLSNLPVADFSFLTGISKNCKMLKSLTLDGIGMPGKCGYQTQLGTVLKEMTCLKELRLRHNYIDLSKSLFDAICTCLNLERLVILALTGSAGQGTAAGIIAVARNCTRLSMFAICAKGISEHCKRTVKKYMTSLNSQSRRSKTMIFIASCEQMDSPLSFDRLLDFQKSVICDYNAHNFPYQK